MRSALLVGAVGLLLAGCMIVSGDRSSADARPESGNVTRSFVGAEGQEEHQIATGAGPAALDVIAIVEAEQGELRLEVLDADGAVVLALQSRPGEQVTRTGTVTTDGEGRLRYRVVTRGARNGGYQILYQRQAGGESDDATHS